MFPELKKVEDLDTLYAFVVFENFESVQKALKTFKKNKIN